MKALICGAGEVGPVVKVNAPRFPRSDAMAVEGRRVGGSEGRSYYLTSRPKWMAHVVETGQTVLLKYLGRQSPTCKVQHSYGYGPTQGGKVTFGIRYGAGAVSVVVVLINACEAVSDHYKSNPYLYYQSLSDGVR